MIHPPEPEDDSLEENADESQIEPPATIGVYDDMASAVDSRPVTRLFPPHRIR